MPYTCPLCELMHSSHSLEKISKKENISYYYTCPSKAILYYDVKGIIEHYDGTLSEMTENEEWIWIFDSTEFGLKHAIQTKVGIELAKLITNKFSQNLKKIIIINPTFYITLTYKMLIPFLNDKVKNIIEINYEINNPDDLFL